MLSNKVNCYKKTIFQFRFFFLPFLAKNSINWLKNEEKWQNPNRLVKFSEIWYVDTFQQKKLLQKNYFLISAFLAFFGQKNSQNWPKMKKIGKIQPFDKIFWNLICRCFPTKENATKKLFFDFGIFGLFWPKRQPELTKNGEN